MRRRNSSARPATFAAAVRDAGKPVELLVGENYSHLELPETLCSPYGVARAAVLEQDGPGRITLPPSAKRARTISAPPAFAFADADHGRGALTDGSGKITELPPTFECGDKGDRAGSGRGNLLGRGQPEPAIVLPHRRDLSSLTAG